MKQRLIASALFALFAFVTPSYAQSTSPIVLPNGCGTGSATNSLSYLTVDSTLKLCVNATVTANVGATAQATLPTLTPGSGNALFESLSSSLYVNPIFGTTQVDATHGLPVNVIAGAAGGGAVFGPTAVGTAAANPPVLQGGTVDGTATGAVAVQKIVSGIAFMNNAQWAGTALGAPSNYGTSPGAVAVPGVNAFVTNNVTVEPGNTPNTTPWLANPTSQYPSGATPITASATGTTAATTATLAGAASKTTYVCGYSIRANATANTNVTNTLTGVISGTMSSIMWVPANTAGLGVDEQIFSPCIPASATNTGISAVSGAPGTGGLVSSKIWGYQL